MYLIPAPAAHTCNPSYSGDRDQEKHGLKQPGQMLCQKKYQKRASRVAQGVGPEFKSQYCKINYVSVKGIHNIERTLYNKAISK
jgi:hypothetical protein